MGKTIVGVVAVAVAAWSAMAFCAWQAFTLSDKKIADFGQTGDAFGSLNALFSAGALVGVLWTLWLQRQELAEQRQTQERQGLALIAAARINAINALLQEVHRRIGETAPSDGKWTQSNEDTLRKNQIVQMTGDRLRWTTQLTGLLTVLEIPPQTPAGHT